MNTTWYSMLDVTQFGPQADPPLAYKLRATVLGGQSFVRGGLSVLCKQQCHNASANAGCGDKRTPS